MLYHLLMRGKTIDELPLETFCGSALTHDLTEFVLGSCFSPDDLKNENSLKTSEIALFYTGSNAPTGSVGRIALTRASISRWLIG